MPKNPFVQRQRITPASSKKRTDFAPTLTAAPLPTSVQTPLTTRPNFNLSRIPIEPPEQTASPSAFTGRNAAVIQTKSAVLGPANDAYEQEADRVAEELVPSASLGSATQGPPAGGPQHLHRGPTATLQRQLDSPQSPALSPNFQTALSSGMGGGSPLPTSLRAQFEPKFGADFSGVRIHNGTRAGELNRAISARAFTTGKDIFFGSGEYQPGTRSGQKMLAHELTHVGQQNPGLLAKPLLANPGHAIQPLRMNAKDGKYYSAAAPNFASEYQAKSQEDAFLTATSGDAIGGGHTAVYLEYFSQDGVPLTYQAELGGGGSVVSGRSRSGAQSGTNDVSTASSGIGSSGGSRSSGLQAGGSRSRSV